MKQIRRKNDIDANYVHYAFYRYPLNSNQAAWVTTTTSNE